MAGLETKREQGPGGAVDGCVELGPGHRHARIAEHEGVASRVSPSGFAQCLSDRQAVDPRGHIIAEITGIGHEELRHVDMEFYSGGDLLYNVTYARHLRLARRVQLIGPASV